MSEQREEEENQARGFKVVDRRRFTDDGDVREGVELSAPEPKKPAAKQASKQPEPAPAAPPPSAPAAEQAPEQPKQAGGDDDVEPGAITFMQFIQSLAQQAMMQLGLMPHPATGQRELMPDGARDTIDILAMLQNKTKGNITAEEAALLKQMVYELRMAYLEVTQAIAKQSMGEAPPS